MALNNYARRARVTGSDTRACPMGTKSNARSARRAATNDSRPVRDVGSFSDRYASRYTYIHMLCSLCASGGGGVSAQWVGKSDNGVTPHYNAQHNAGAHNNTPEPPLEQQQHSITYAVLKVSNCVNDAVQS
jgi:hypothetical protein